MQSVSEELIQGLERFRSIAQAKRPTTPVAVFITSGFRCKERQEKIRGLKIKTAKATSTHELGGAADITIPGLPGKVLEAMAEEAGFEAVGVSQTFIHVDTRKGKRRRWTY
jgi:uncharacterized protein YcbK (DUF882 family)